MTVGEFCRRKTQPKELCVIRIDGYITATAWIDYEDLFAINIPCHYIDC